MKTSIFLTLITALAVPTFADYNSDIAEARTLNKAGKLTEARTLLKSLAEKETIPSHKDAALVLAASMLAYSDLKAGLNELQTLGSTQAKARWVGLSLVLGKASINDVESVAKSIPAPLTRAVMTSAFIKEKQWSKARDNFSLLISEVPVQAPGVFIELIKNADSVFTSKDDQVEYFNNLLRKIPAVESNAKLLGIIKSQLEILK